MPKISFEEITFRFPARILEEAKQRKSNKDASLEERFKLLGVVSILEVVPLRNVRTAEIARECGVTESTLYKHIPKPVIETLFARALQSLREDFHAPRNGVLLDVATQLAIDDSVDFPSAVSSWSEVYGAVANPASVYQAVLSLPQEAGSLIAAHADMITDNMKLLGLRNGSQTDDRIGLRVLPAVAAYDMTDGLTELGAFTEQTIVSHYNS